jgi:hypothetical protein
MSRISRWVCTNTTPSLRGMHGMHGMHGALLGIAASIAIASPASAGSHLWDFWEIFSNPDGTVQFIELHISTNANQEIGLAGKKVTSQATGKVFTFPSNLVPPTGFKYLLLATSGFAALPGAPTPDYIIPDHFFSTTGDTLKYHVYDTITFTSGQVPTDCVHSLNRNHTTGLNTPTNYAGATGSVDACPPCPGDVDGSGAVDGADIGAMLAAWGTADAAADVNHDGTVDGADLGSLLGAWGDCP